MADMDTIAAQLRDALNARDMTAFRALIADDATWGEGDHPRTCHDRDQIISTYQRLLDQGVTGTVVDTTTGPRGVICSIEIDWPEAMQDDRRTVLYQVFRVSDGLVTKIEGHDDWDLALSSIAT